MTTTRVFSGLLSNLVVADGIAAGTLTHTLRNVERVARITIAADVLVRITDLSEGPAALYGELDGDVLTVLGPDLRRKTLAAARPRGEMGPPAPQNLACEIVSYGRQISKATGKVYLKGTLRLADGLDRTYLVRNSDLAIDMAENLSDSKSFREDPIDLTVVMMGDVIEVIGIPAPVMNAPKRALTREQKDAKNARARARRAAKKEPMNG